MPKGEYDTPGPFDRTRMLVRRTFAPASGLDVQPQMSFVETLDEAERDELVGLLNKGTHFEKLRRSVEDLKACLEGPISDSGPMRELHHHETRRALTAAVGLLMDTAGPLAEEELALIWAERHETPWRFFMSEGGAYIFACPKCAGESYRVGKNQFHREACLTKGCDGMREPILIRDLETRWWPLWKRHGMEPSKGSDYEHWLETNDA